MVPRRTRHVRCDFEHQLRRLLGHIQRRGRHLVRQAKQRRLRHAWEVELLRHLDDQFRLLALLHRSLLIRKRHVGIGHAEVHEGRSDLERPLPRIRLSPHRDPPRIQLRIPSRVHRNQRLGLTFRNRDRSTRAQSRRNPQQVHLDCRFEPFLPRRHHLQVRLTTPHQRNLGLHHREAERRLVRHHHRQPARRLDPERNLVLTTHQRDVLLNFPLDLEIRLGRVLERGNQFRQLARDRRLGRRMEQHRHHRLVRRDRRRRFERHTLRQIDTLQRQRPAKIDPLGRQHQTHPVPLRDRNHRLHILHELIRRQRQRRLHRSQFHPIEVIHTAILQMVEHLHHIIPIVGHREPQVAVGAGAIVISCNRPATGRIHIQHWVQRRSQRPRMHPNVVHFPLLRGEPIQIEIARRLQHPIERHRRLELRRLVMQLVWLRLHHIPKRRQPEPLTRRRNPLLILGEHQIVRHHLPRHGDLLFPLARHIPQELHRRRLAQPAPSRQ